MKLLPHNKTTLAEIETFDKHNMNCCVVNPCGSGKTSVMAAFIQQHPRNSFTIITKQKNAKKYYQEKDKVFQKNNVNIVTYNKMLSDYRKKNTAQYNTTYFLIDEAHYLGAPQWKIAFEFLQNEYKPRIIGFTATPQRFEDQFTKNDIVKTFFDDNRAGNYTTTDLEAEGVFVKPEYILSIYDFPTLMNNMVVKIKTSDLDEDQKQKLYTRLDIAGTKWRNESMPQMVFQHYIPKYLYKKNNNRILVYVSNIKDLDSKKTFIDSLFKTIFPKKHIVSYVYTYKNSETELQKFLSDDESTDIKILYSIDKIMETIHIDDLRILVMLRPSVSNRIITQQFGRINSIKNKNKPLIIDMVDNLSVIDKNGNPKRDYTKTAFDTELPTTNQNVGISLPHIAYYADLFATIDKAISQIQRYTYRGYTGTLTNICKIFDIDINQLKELLKTTIDVETALDQSQTKKYRLTQAIFDMLPTERHFELTSEEKDVAQKNLNIVDAFIQNNNIDDDDLKQELYMEYLYAIHKNKSSNTPLTIRIANALRNEYIYYCRNKLRHDELYTELPLDCIDDEPSHDPYFYAMHNEVHDKIEQLFGTLMPRQAGIIKFRYGFIDGHEHTLEETGLMYDITRERVRQIEAKGLRILRNPWRSKSLKDYLNDYA